MIKEKYIAKIPYECASDEQVWLEIYPHIHKGEIVGYYLNTYIDLSQDSTSDTWFKELEHAKQAALEDYGIVESDWIKDEANSENIGRNDR
ncbi:MAG: hypothetical protein IPG60_06705 [Bacteroidetes bacterium]|nr:hypothetical protein [Bacteroidota bacterium]MBP7540592.1 hypothetical protein [Saprospiraceae bacterium]MBK7110409.1 hypothetical protein [Bacteroidota bacterium]MBK8488311.1 hypothetical protein [Bacteroidota bacterium]MBK8681930.1 hypothetical protein [Bacteroidota bacterium]